MTRQRMTSHSTAHQRRLGMRLLRSQSRYFLVPVLFLFFHSLVRRWYKQQRTKTTRTVTSRSTPLKTNSVYSTTIFPARYRKSFEMWLSWLGVHYLTPAFKFQIDQAGQNSSSRLFQVPYLIAWKRFSQRINSKSKSSFTKDKRIFFITC